MIRDQNDSDFDASNDGAEDFGISQSYALRSRRKTRRTMQLDDMDEEEEEPHRPQQQHYTTRSREHRAGTSGRERNEQQAVVNTRTRGRRQKIRFDDDDDENDDQGREAMQEEETKAQEITAPQSSRRFLRATNSATRNTDARPATRASVVEPSEATTQIQEASNGSEQTVARRRPLRPQPLQREPSRVENLAESEENSRSNRIPTSFDENEDIRVTRRRGIRPQFSYRDNMMDVEEPIRTTRRTALLNDSELFNSDRFDSSAVNPPSTQCSRCFEDNARIKCDICQKNYHQKCSKLRGSQTAISITRTSFLCFECQYVNRKNKKDVSNYTQVTRAWPSFDIQETKLYAPQVGDKVYYIFQAHEEFIAKYFSNLNFDEAEDILPFVRYPDLQLETECEITAIKYEFPISTKRVKSSDIPCIVSCLTLSIIQTGQSFKVRYFPQEGNDWLQFLIPKSKYEKAMAIFKSVRVNSTVDVMFSGEYKKLFISEVINAWPFENSNADK